MVLKFYVHTVILMQASISTSRLSPFLLFCLRLFLRLVIIWSQPMSKTIYELTPSSNHRIRIKDVSNMFCYLLTMNNILGKNYKLRLVLPYWLLKSTTPRSVRSWLQIDKHVILENCVNYHTFQICKRKPNIYIFFSLHPTLEDTVQTKFIIAARLV